MSNNVKALQGITARELRELANLDETLDDCVAWFKQHPSDRWTEERRTWANMASTAYGRRKHLIELIDRRILEAGRVTR